VKAIRIEANQSTRGALSMLEHRRMLRRFLPVLLVSSLGAIPLGAGGCNRAGGPGPVSPQPIRDEKEPGESLDTVSAVPDSGSSGVEEMTSGSSESELEIDEGDSSDGDGDAGKDDGDKSAGADRPDDEAGADGGEDETGDEPDDIDIDVEP
jgi:hypothetical protein